LQFSTLFEEEQEEEEKEEDSAYTQVRCEGAHRPFSQ